MSPREQKLDLALRAAFRLRRAIINPLSELGLEPPNYRVPRQAVLDFDEVINSLKEQENEPKNSA